MLEECALRVALGAKYFSALGTYWPRHQIHQGIGVDRMYREMVVLGHRPPSIREISGPSVRTRLVGGRPVVPIMRLTTRLTPQARQRDVQVALVIHTLLHEPFTTPERLARILQRSKSEAAEALEITSRCVIDELPIISPYKKVWLLSPTARSVVLGTKADEALVRRLSVLWYVAPSVQDARTVVEAWLSAHDRVTSGDYAALTGLTNAGARRALERMLGDLLERGDETGRNAHFLPLRGRSA